MRRGGREKGRMSDTPRLSELAARLRQRRPVYPQGRFAGRGIVIAAGGASLFTNAYVLVSILRHTLRSALPVEVWHFGPAEMSPHMAALLGELDVTVVDAVPRIAAAGADIRDGWQLKAFCLFYAGFEEVLLLDADQVPVIDPAALFEWPQYRETGAIFWPDIVSLRRDNPVWQALGLEPPAPSLSFEAGQILVDKRRHWPALTAALALNEAADELYRLIYGDKDSFLLAWMLTGSPFSLVPHIPFRGDRCLFQRDFEGNRLFQHRTNGKWRYDGEQTPSENFHLLDDCLAALETLRRKWNGRVFNAPDRAPAAREMEGEIAGRRFHLELLGDPPVDLEFLPSGEFGEGRAANRQNWWCDTDGSVLRLNISDGPRVTYRFTPGDEGRWRGELLTPQRRDAALVPHGDAVRPVIAGRGIADLLIDLLGPDPTAWPTARELVARLAHAEPGIAARLAELARDREPAGGHLTALLAEIEERTRLQPVEMRTDILMGNYFPVVGARND